MVKNIVILGSTGKIGTQALEVIASYPKEFKVLGLACQHKSDLFQKQIRDFKPQIAIATKESGEDKLIDLATHPKADLIIVAVVGLAGLLPTLAAIKKGKTIALATKEVMVIAGPLMMLEAKKHKAKIIPLDSEHSAIFQCLTGAKTKAIKNIYLTMGKGPIAKMKPKQLEKITMTDIINRPCWTMGTKISVDSATGINKAFEVIEAHYLFNLKSEQIKIIVHPEYSCHSLVEFVDQSMLTELGTPDMKRYLQYALFYPERKINKVSQSLNLYGKTLSFAKPDFAKFPCLKLGHEAIGAGASMPSVLHGADKACVEGFLNKKIKFTQFYKLIKKTMQKHQTIKNPNLKQLIKLENWAYQFTKENSK